MSDATYFLVYFLLFVFCSYTRYIYQTPNSHHLFYSDCPVKSWNCVLWELENCPRFVLLSTVLGDSVSQWLHRTAPSYTQPTNHAPTYALTRTLILLPIFFHCRHWLRHPTLGLLKNCCLPAKITYKN
jgi:hypothetical protein